MTIIVFDPSGFRAATPAYADLTAYPDATLQAYFDAASGYISTNDYGYLNGARRVQALNLMTAHLLFISSLVQTGEFSGVVVSSTIDRISVSFAAPPAGSQFQYWLNLSPYGMQLIGILARAARGGKYIGGSPERFGFRGICGR